MTRATAIPRAAQAGRARNGKATAAGAGGNGERGAGTKSAAASGARDQEILRYSDADLEPIRAALAAFRAGDLRHRPKHGEQAEAGHADRQMLTELSLLADEVGSQLASLTSEVTDKAAQVRDIADITTAVARGDLTRR